ncbi:MAG TPA: hypoxanthine phosphoribosyltransferase [Hellea balneolensis]|uniref:Hypoxanthine phosphoribosyltransferase n=1 Tax=Hellea balneolensis TaxID=287478 RepID=A0A7C3C5B2_9PROT|nr:hypoxanthine phosphoribosyltransferase [Hellea balneolensis]
MVDKVYLKSQDLLDDSFALAAKILESGFRPRVIIALWRGGTPIGIAVQEFLDYYGDCNSDNIAIRTSSYQGVAERRSVVDIYGMSYLLKNLNHEDSVLIVDDVFDSGHTIKAVIDQLTAKARNNTPHDIRVAVPWYKPTANQTDRVPDYYVHTTDKWLNFPYELDGVTPEEMREHIPEIYDIVKSVL